MKKMDLEYFTKDREFPFYIQYGYHTGDVASHFHDDYVELVIVLDGLTQHIVGNTLYTISKGDVFVIGSHTEHEFINSKEFKLCNIMFRSKAFFDDLFQLKEAPGFHALFILEPFMTKNYEFKSRLKLTFDEYNKVVELLEKLMKEYNNEATGRKVLVRAYFMELLVYLTRIYQLPRQKEGEGVLFIAKAGAYIEKHFREQINIESIALATGMSQRHMSRIFKATYGKTPMQYVMDLRMNYSSYLLKNTDLRVTEIALESGFSENNYFARVFRKYYGSSPNQYRLIKE